VSPRGPPPTNPSPPRWPARPGAGLMHVRLKRSLYKSTLANGFAYMEIRRHELYPLSPCIAVFILKDLFTVQTRYTDLTTLCFQ
jgi:hypothetical protein